MAKIKTTETSKKCDSFINAVANEVKRKDSFEITNLMQQLTGSEAKMWEPSIVGFGKLPLKRILLQKMGTTLANEFS